MDRVAGMRGRQALAAGGLILVIAVVAQISGRSLAAAAEPTVGLGTAAGFAILAGATITNTGPSVINGDIGVSPGSAVTGFPPGQVTNGVTHTADASALQAKVDLTAAYDDAAGRTPPTAAGVELGGLTLVGGVYGNTTLGITGTLTLDAEGDPNAVFVFQSAATLITGMEFVYSAAI
ncbi:MAG: ice-binding family protein [Nakamurella sp.]